MRKFIYRAARINENHVTLFCNEFPLASFYRRDDGWRVIPNTASGSPSRKSHATLLAAAARYSKDAKAALRAIGA